MLTPFITNKMNQLHFFFRTKRNCVAVSSSIQGLQNRQELSFDNTFDISLSAPKNSHHSKTIAYYALFRVFTPTFKLGIVLNKTTITRNTMDSWPNVDKYPNTYSQCVILLFYSRNSFWSLSFLAAKETYIDPQQLEKKLVSKSSEYEINFTAKHKTIINKTLNLTASTGPPQVSITPTRIL